MGLDPWQDLGWWQKELRVLRTLSLRTPPTAAGIVEGEKVSTTLMVESDDWNRDMDVIARHIRAAAEPVKP